MIIDIILYLVKQNLAFRKKMNESRFDLNIINKVDTNFKNRGNFMQLVKLISKYDINTISHNIKNCIKKCLNIF